MAFHFDPITGTDEIFNNPEYINDSVIFNSIESARTEENYHLYSDHKNVIISTSQKGQRVWIWTSSSIKDDTGKLIDICRFLCECRIPKVEIYVKPEVAGHLSDLYSLASLDINYFVKDEFSLAVFTYCGDGITAGASKPAEDEKIIRIDQNNPQHVKFVTDFYTDCKDEFRWNDKFDRKLQEYLHMELYALIKNNKMIANAAIGSRTEKFIRIKSIAVLQSERRKGYGYKMCAFAINKIKETNLTPMLYAHVGNTAAMALWKKASFQLTNKLCLLKIDDPQS